MSVLSIDVGIKNLALCLFSADKEILLWDVLNLSCPEPPAEIGGGGIGGAAETESIPAPTKCSLCKNNAKYRKNETLYCLRHAKESAYLLPTKDLLPAKMHKLTMPDLKELVETFSIDTTPLAQTKKRKSDYRETIAAQVLEPLHGATSSTTTTQVKASDISLVDIARNLTNKLNRVLQNHPTIDTVIIENQISPIATRMMSIQGMLTQYFIMKNATQSIQYISAKNKLKDFDVDKECYADRKKSSVEICKTQIAAASNARWETFFCQHKKKDDLADCYLQGLWYLAHHGASG